MVVGPGILGSPDVNVNERPALRVRDVGIHAACCGQNMWTATRGAATVFINGRAAHRLGDMQSHCGGTGQLIEGSADVFVGDAGGAGGGSGRSGSSGASGGADGAAGAGQATSGGSSRASGGGADASVAGRAYGQVQGRSHDGAARRAPSYLEEYEAPPIRDEELTWLDVRIVDQYGEPWAGVDYEIELTNGQLRQGKLDAEGEVRIDGIPPGTCTISLPDEQPPFSDAVDSPPQAEDTARAWVHFELNDQSGTPLAGERVTVVLPDGTRREVVTDERGAAFLDDIARGTCLVLIPDEKPPAPPEPKREPPSSVSSERHWLELLLVDQDGAPLARETVNVRLPDGAHRKVTLDGRGHFRLEEVPPGTCEVLLPDEPAPARRPR